MYANSLPLWALPFTPNPHLNRKKTIEKEIKNVPKYSYLGWYDPFCEVPKHHWALPAITVIGAQKGMGRQ